ncbi:hypothetical protein [Neopusillimonas maritima]|jgi:hypothetical protein|uniref:Transcriptional regulator n=1 Tax=Neopusillimonas maritima TaxID=2026239 RepID=A0ABX9MY81_9BURK|nr:hypothetical protein [Neopusillimonas maritima]RII83859.1 hypothetical protein CJO09_01040 [Neopusillimonas maritima]
MKKFTSMSDAISGAGLVLKEIESLPADSLVPSDLVAILFGGCTKQTLRRYVTIGLLPKPVRSGPFGRRNCWAAGELRASLKGTRRAEEVINEQPLKKRRGRPRKDDEGLF